MDKNSGRYFYDDGTEFDPDLIPKPDLCITCQKDRNQSEVVLCNLTRGDQDGENTFKCYGYVPISEKLSE